MNGNVKRDGTVDEALSRIKEKSYAVSYAADSRSLP